MVTADVPVLLSEVRVLCNRVLWILCSNILHICLLICLLGPFRLALFAWPFSLLLFTPLFSYLLFFAFPSHLSVHIPPPPFIPSLLFLYVDPSVVRGEAAAIVQWCGVALFGSQQNQFTKVLSLLRCPRPCPGEWSTQQGGEGLGGGATGGQPRVRGWGWEGIDWSSIWLWQWRWVEKAIRNIFCWVIKVIVHVLLICDLWDVLLKWPGIMSCLH